jgi:predicted membrane GTPase involved in stress response
MVYSIAVRLAQKQKWKNESATMTSLLKTMVQHMERPKERENKHVIFIVE